MEKRALLIGINEYQFLPGLKYARQDAEAVAEALKQNYSFTDDEIMLLTDVGSGYLNPSNRMVIRKNLDKLANQELDLFIFGFWGHGLFRNGERYLCPRDVMGDVVEELGFSFETLQQQLSRIHAKNTFMILDCCQTIHDRGDEETLTVDDQTSMEKAVRDIFLKRKEQIPNFQSNVAILNSCMEGQSAYEWDERQHGLFTVHLLDAMRKRSNSVMQIASYISSNIEKTAMELGKEQTPFYKLEGDIVLPVETKSTPLVTGDVFISYRHCNADLTVPVEAELKRRGISYFIDRVGINYSMDYSTVIARAIKACKVLLVMWTREANDSPDMLKEVVTASNLKKKVLPYKLGTFNEQEHDGLYLQLSTLSHCDDTKPDSVVNLVNQIQLLLDPSAPIPPAPVPPPKSSSPTPIPHSSENPLQDILDEEEREKQEKIKQLQIAAASDYKNKDYEEAIPKLEEILTLDSNSTEAQKLLARCKSKLSQQQARLEIQKATTLFNKREFAQAISICESVLKLDPNSKDAQKLLSICQSELESQKAEEERKRRIAEEAERKRIEAQRKAEEERKRREAEVARIAEEERKKHDLSIPGTKAGERRTVIVNGMEFAFRWCPAGTFMMGAPGSTQHRVTLTRGFWMMETQVTQKHWQAVMGSNPSRYKNWLTDDDLPVEQVSWIDCQEFCKKCALLGLIVQLPTEAQWEYACRAGTTGAYAGNLDEMAWYRTGTTHSVGTKKPNAWGLYDMYGNVWEWCQDWKGDYPNWSVTDPTGPSTGSRRIIRGGSWFSGPESCNSTNRESDNQANRSHRTGFRCVKCQ